MEMVGSMEFKMMDESSDITITAGLDRYWIYGLSRVTSLLDYWYASHLKFITVCIGSCRVGKTGQYVSFKNNPTMYNPSSILSWVFYDLCLSQLPIKANGLQ